MAEDTYNHPATPTSPSRQQWPSGYYRRDSQNSLHQSPPKSAHSMKRKQLPSLPQTPTFDEPEVRLQQTPVSPVRINPPTLALQMEDAAEMNFANWEGNGEMEWQDPARNDSGMYFTADSGRHGEDVAMSIRSRPTSTQIRVTDETSHSRGSSGSHPRIDEEETGGDSGSDVPQVETLQYHAFDDAPKKRGHAHNMSQRTTGSSSSGGDHRASQGLGVPRTSAQRPLSTNTLGSELRGRTLSPLSANDSDPGSQYGHSRDPSRRRSPTSRPTSYIDLLNNVPHNQQVAPSGTVGHLTLQNSVGSAASLLDTKKTLEMYRANVKKTNDAAVQYEFAILMINTARDAPASAGLNPPELINEAKHILQRLADRAYPFAQYYLGDGHFSGLFSSKQKPDRDKAFPLFLAASKHSHAEATYRAALCYEFGWGTTKSYPKAVQFYRAAASKNHPGAATRLGLACIRGDMGLLARERYREGVKWLKRAQESADTQYNAAPYELGLLHLTGHGDDIFKDEAYAAQLFTQSAELGHVVASFLMGQAYEEGKLGCPRDAALSVHFYYGAAGKGHAEAMMALCAWFMVGAEPVLERDEGEAYAWAKQAAELGFPKAEYALGYFTEMGIGCRRDPLEANVWYVAAAEKGNETARQRLLIIRAAAAGTNDAVAAAVPMGKAEARQKELKGGKKFMGIF